MVLHPIVLFPKFHNLSLTMKKSQTERHSTKRLTDTPENRQGHENEGKTETVTKDLWQQNAIHTLDWLLGQKEDTDGKAGEVRIKSRV